MLDKELLDTILKKTLGKGGEYADLFVEWRRPTFIQIEDDKVEKVVSGTESGAGLRLIYEGRTYYAYSNDLSETALMEIAGSLSAGIKSGRAVSDINFNLKTQRPKVDFVIKTPPETVGVDRKIKLVESANRVARGVSDKIRQVSVIYRDSIQKVQIATSTGEIVEDERVQTVALVSVVAEEGGVIQTGYEPIGGHIGFEIFDEISLDDVARNSAEKAVRMLKARRAPGGRMPVVVSSTAGGTMIHEAIGHGLEADLSGQGLSAFSGKLGAQVASTIVSVLDDATIPGKRGSFRFDDEGTPSQRTVLVKDGILVGFMYDRLSAMREKKTPTGNGRRQSYEYRPIPRMTNTFIAPGSHAPEEILKSTNSGLFVAKMGGGQVNTVTGEFVFDVTEGYLIEGGRIGELVRGATLTGSGPEVLMSIDMVGTDMGFSIGTCGKDSQGVPVSDAMPTVRIPEMVVGGEVKAG